MADFGRICVVAAFAVAVYLTVASALGITGSSALLLASARRAVYAAAALVSLAWLTLVLAFVRHDFSIEAVAGYNSRFNSLAYSISGAYASQAGSLLMWAWGVAMVMLITTLQFRGQQKGFMPWATAVMGAVATLFLALVTFVSDPFAKSQVIPADGKGLNPLLENVGMLFHPPTLYIGYVAFTVPFAFAIAALITGRLGDEWIRLTRRWALTAWAFLTVGNILGAQWAYVELGWGGYWGWDPVENSSFMPWLTGTAFLHSAMVQKRRGMFKIWNLVLIIATFLLTIFGTFLTRSDILSSVHTFGNTGLGPVLVAFMALVIIVSVALIFHRMPLLRSDTQTESFASREAAFLLNNLLLACATFAVFWGTMFPVISQLFSGAKVTVNASFFNQVAGPILLAVVVLMGVCPLLVWGHGSAGRVFRALAFPLAFALATSAISFSLGAREIWALAGLAAMGFVCGTLAREFYRGARAKGRATGRSAILALLPAVLGNKPRYGAYLVHLGIALMVVGVVGSYGFKTEREVSLTPGQEVTIGGYRVVYNGLLSSKNGRKDVVSADMAVYSGSQMIDRLRPSVEFTSGGDEHGNTEVAIRSTPTEDLYLILSSWDQQKKAGLKLVINPLVMWIWIGGYLLVFGALLAWWPQREERPQEAEDAAPVAGRGRIGELAEA